MRPLDTSPLLLVLLLLSCSALAADTTQCFDGISFEEVLRRVELPSCLAQKSGGDCSLMQHLRSLAARENKDLKELTRRAAVLVLAHSSFGKELATPGNPLLEVAERTSQHMGYFAVTKCLVGETFCQKLRMSCKGSPDSAVFLVSGHCSEAVRCAPMSASFDNGDRTELLHMQDYLEFRVLERQLFVAKDLGEVQLAVSNASEYLIQSEMNDSHSDSVLQHNQPLAVFMPGASKHAGYYSLFSRVIDAALRLKGLFAFHFVTASLSDIEAESERPAYRKPLHKHEALLALYTQRHCSGSSEWAFSCQPIAAKADAMLTSPQVAGFLLHEVLKQLRPDGQFPAFGGVNPYLSAFVKLSDTYVFGVVPLDEMLTDKFIDWENLKILASYLTSSFTVAYYPVIVTKAVAMELLQGENTGLNLEESLEGPCFLIRLPSDAGFTILRIDQPVMVLDQTVRSVKDKTSAYQRRIRESQEYLSLPEESTLPSQLISSGHFAGSDGVFDASEDTKEALKDSMIEGRVDAFVEQVNFREVYNVSGVLVVETQPTLVRDFFDKVGQEKPWLVVFVVSWSPLCKAARTILSSVGQCVRDMGLHDIQVAKVDCFEANDLCNKASIQEYPTIAMFNKGKMVANYSGPISTGSICQFANLALQDPVLTAGSQKESQQLASKFLPLRSRVFVYEGQKVPAELAQLAAELHPSELFIHQKSQTEKSRLTAIYKDMYPETNTFAGSLVSVSEMKDFVENGHLDSVFPCTWTHLPQALARDKPLTVLFRTTAKESSDQLLQHLHTRFSPRTSVCSFDVKSATHLSDMVRKVAGLSLPALVLVARRPAGDKRIYRLPLGAIKSDSLQGSASDWLDKALSHQLADASPVEPLGQWQPATTVYNFVEEVYSDKAADDGEKRNTSSRLLSPQEPEEEPEEEPEPPMASGKSQANSATMQQPTTSHVEL